MTQPATTAAAAAVAHCVADCLLSWYAHYLSTSLSLSVSFSGRMIGCREDFHQQRQSSRSTYWLTDWLTVRRQSQQPATIAHTADHVWTQNQQQPPQLQRNCRSTDWPNQSLCVRLHRTEPQDQLDKIRATAIHDKCHTSDLTRRRRRRDRSINCFSLCDKHAHNPID